MSERMVITISMQIGGKDILKYLYSPTIELIPYDELEKLQAAIEAFVIYTLSEHAAVPRETGEEASQ